MIFKYLTCATLTIALLYPALCWAGAAVPKQRQAAQQKQIKQQQIEQARVQMRVKEMQMNAPAIPVVVAPEEVKDVVQMSDILAALARSSEAWGLMIDMEAKAAVVSHFISVFARNGVVIEKPPAYYAQAIDGMTQSRNEMLSMPFPDLLQTIAIIEYDFNNGMDKDALARKVLGENAWVQNRKRLGLSP